MVDEKGLAGDVADRIGHYVKLHGGMEMLEQLAADPALVAVPDAKVGLDEMRTLLKFCELFGALDKVRRSARKRVDLVGSCRPIPRCPLTSAWPAV